MKTLRYILFSILFLCITVLQAQIVLEVKQGKSAILKKEPKGSSQQIGRLSSGERVVKIGDFPRYYSIQLSNGNIAFSYKGNFKIVEGTLSAPVTKESVWARTDVLKIITIDVEVGDATLIICPEQNGKQDIILIDTGVNDGDRIKAELKDNGFDLSDQPITRYYNTHYDRDHMGDIGNVAHLISMAYDTGNKYMPSKYKRAMKTVDRRLMTLDYEEVFSGGVKIECVAVNNATDFDPDLAQSNDKNTNSIALVISYNGFDYFTAGDLTLRPERSLAKGIRDCDVYHVNHHGSSRTSSDLSFIQKLSPEVSVVSNGRSYGHPNAIVGNRLINEGSLLFQTNINPDDRSFRNNPKHIGDAEFINNREENKEGAKGSIRLVVGNNKYYVIMPNLPIDEGTFSIER